MHFKIHVTAILLAAILFSCQKPINQKHVIAFYNLENLFDTINNEGVRDIEFTPEGDKKWNTERYLSKLNNMSSVISQLGKDEGINGPSIIGLCEMENKLVLEDLVNMQAMKSNKYKIIHSDSPDQRGIDVALLYNPDNFNILSHQTYPLIIHDIDSGNRIFTRDQLLVKGILNNDSIYLIVNHWPSRYGGKERSIPLRRDAALLNRKIIDSLLQINPHEKIITMGDFNDDPSDPSITNYLKAKDSKAELETNDLFNPLATYFKDSKGSLFYRGKWNLFDQMIVSQGLINSNGIKIKSATIFNKPFLIQQDGKYKGHLFRTFGGKNYLNGYSDHLPVFLIVE